MSVSRNPTPAGRNFVLVHGGFHGGWCFRRVADILLSHGHRPFTPTLTGLGERSHLLHAGVDCALHVQDVCNLLEWEELDSVVLCGHSYGGIIIGAVADAMPHRVSSLVYVDAAVPEDGKSTLDALTDADRTALEALVVVQNGVDVLPPFPATTFNVNEADRAMVDRLCTPQPFATLRQRLKLSGAHDSVARKIYVRATGWPGTHPQESYDRVRNKPGWAIATIDCGHDVMLDAPEALAKILLEA